ncbi:MAG: enoyl-CoA hydratase/isomerase family protein [Betaproteobacteria bacterium]|nr:enoyl-CoA hydratase/isomerase family protein [Betaproteobacteria bacterium]MSQ88625.1 enoyl-CoA hydratase/isomerase family protein [Betaproteobacteria bacterium]
MTDNVLEQAVKGWARTAPARTTELSADKAGFGHFWQRAAELLARLPPKSKRDAGEAAAAAEVLGLARDARTRFMRAHARGIYDSLTAKRSLFLRVDELCARAATEYPGLAPGVQELARESCLPQGEKDGLEFDQGIFLSQVLGDPLAGAHLCHAMLLPRARAQELLPGFLKTGKITFDGAQLERQGKACVLTIRNPQYLNAEDESTLEGLELAVDLALLDPASEVCILRGDKVTHPKYAGQRLFGAGINLTHLYQGKIRFLWYLIRDLGLVNKLYRGLALPDTSPEEDSIEKLWIAAVEGFAIGGHCQILLTIDQVIATQTAYLTLPARKEGIIPGAANLRLARHVGDRVARQAIFAERRIDCASPEGRLICDAIVAPEAMDAELARLVNHLTSSGMVSAAGNRRALRIVEEPLDDFRRYMAVYAREQAHCHFSPALIANLEQHWDAANRRG